MISSLPIFLAHPVECEAGAPLPDGPVPDRPVRDELPDPFRRENGERVQTPDEWSDRCDEILALLLRYEYGHLPSPPGNVAVASQQPDVLRNGGKSKFRQLRLKMGPQERVTMRVHLYLPTEKPGPYPAIVRIGLGCPAVAEINRRGYLLACFEHRDLDPETEGHDVAGPAQQAYPRYDWGSIAVWAWGASRLVDYLESRNDVNLDRVVVTGHSRTGKAALLAGAMDRRFAVVVPNGSGCGGAACYRIAKRDAETLELITRPTRFRSWFQQDFGRFAGQENRLPFDQHFLRALVAPRAVLTTDALGDHWCNPLGTQAAYQAAQPVFDFLGAPQNNALHFRPGDHDQLAEDIRVLLDFADAYFSQHLMAKRFTLLPCPDYHPTYRWRAPEN